MVPKPKNVNNNDIECLNVEILRKASKTLIISYVYRLPRGEARKFLDEMRGDVIKNKFQEKPLFLVGDLNVNSLDYSRNRHVRDFFAAPFVEQLPSQSTSIFLSDKIILNQGVMYYKIKRC